MVDAGASAAASSLLPAETTREDCASICVRARPRRVAAGGGVEPRRGGASPWCSFHILRTLLAIAQTGLTGIGRLTAVDGAVVLTDRQELLGFGAKIVRRKGQPQVDQIVVSEPVEGAVPLLVSPEQLGGTRHFSAAQFVQDQHDAVALVASQDGRFTIFEWSEAEQAVHAHRLDALLY